MVKVEVVVVLLVLGVLGAVAKPKWHELETLDYNFGHYMKDFNKHYTGDELQMRREIFETTLASIKAHNADSSKGWKEGVNHLTDRTASELKQLRGYKKSYTMANLENKAGLPYEFRSQSVPHSVDWRKRGIISAVKDQGQCGSCWTFGTAETIESYWALAKDQLPVLSEQQILDCTPNPNQCGGTGGCGGGTAELAMTQIIKMGGLSSEWTYPYRSYWGVNFPKCSFNNSRTPPAATIKNFVNLPVNKYEPILEALAHEGPLAIAVDASAWNKYETGVFDGCNKTNPDIDHAVQLIGYGSDHKEGDYWIVRNSWTPAWGEDGFIRLKRDSKPHCGIDINPQDGTECKNGPPTVEVCGTCGVLFDAVYPIV
eukprot:TRINITY_DN194_c0_g1_i1.p1 TRINITY_DN194_c0_g1~~TRINITY_DN194_c0_g1_i1.p1  ORF type:complete len:371 (+),score=70.69 TRINITY_DN194_c0_g1_i1:42-1154(+)